MLLAAPAGGTIDAADLDAQPVGLRPGTDRDRLVGIAVVDLAAGAESTVSFYLALPPGCGVPAFVHTPTFVPWP